MTVLDAGDREGIDLLREALAAAGYDAHGFAEALGPQSIGADAAEREVLRRRLGDDARSALVKLFALGLALPDEQAQAALGPLPLERAQVLGLVRADGDETRAAVRLGPAAGLTIAWDFESDRTDQVVGVTPSSLLLAGLAVRRDARDALDVGTGCGIQALLCAGHSRRVVATDVTERALAFAAFNARLNGIANVETRLGSFLEPAAGGRFDLVLCNPPFVISPETTFVYRDSGLPSHEVCERIVRGVPDLLAQGGFASLVLCWGLRGDEDWWEPPARWLDAAGCDALLLRYTTEDPLTYAAGWNRARRGDAHLYGESLDRWVAHHAELGFDALVYGAAVLRRRDGGNWLRTEDVAAERIGPAGDHVERMFAAQDHLAALTRDDDLLDGVFRTAGRQRLDQVLRAGDGGYAVESARLVLEDGLGFAAGIDGIAADLVARLESPRPLRDALAEVAAERDVDVERVAGAALPVVRRMLELGFLAPGR